MIILFLNKFKTASYLTPPSLRATSPIFCVAKHLVRLRDAEGKRTYNAASNILFHICL